MLHERMKAAALEAGEMDGVGYMILPGVDMPPEVTFRPGFNGYAVFPARPVQEPGYGGVVSCVRVHGGVTFAEEDDESGAMIYGFDTAHIWSARHPVKSRTWMRLQIARMIMGIRRAAELEPKWLAGGESGRAEVDAELSALGDGTGEDCDIVGRVVVMLDRIADDDAEPAE